MSGNRNHISIRKGKKLFVFKAVSILLPFVLILFVEIGLRIFGYGHDLRLFVEDGKNQNNWVMNPHASERYFTNSENATTGYGVPFRKNKAAGTLRVFVLGESTTAGFPYMASASFHSWLYYRLMHTFPDRKFEIVNVSLTAVNSWTVRGFAKEVADCQPDAVLVYCGHNEYYGAMGVGSTSRFGSNRAVVKSLLYLRSFRLVQLVGNAWSGMKQAMKGRHINMQESLMRRMAAKQEIPFGSADYQRGVDQFRANIEDVCRLFSERKVPVFVSTLVSNEKDLKPFISSKADSASSANYHYSLAGKACQAGDFPKAKQEFVQAKDLDLLRFRAPEALNRVIESLPQKFSGVYVVDTKKVFEEHSPHGILGGETLLEHVHPNIYGFGLMSEAFYLSMKQHGLISPRQAEEIPFEKLRREMPITKVDSLKGLYEIMALKEKWPFNQPKTLYNKCFSSFEEKLAAALLSKKIEQKDAAIELGRYYMKHNELDKLMRVSEFIVLINPNDPALLDVAAQCCMDAGHNDKAEVYLRQSWNYSSTPEAAKKLGFLFLKDDRPEEALPYLDYLGKNDRSGTNFNTALSLTNGIVVLKNKLRADTANVDLLNKIAQNYFKIGIPSVSLRYANRAYGLDKQNKNTNELLGILKPAPGKN